MNPTDQLAADLLIRLDEIPQSEVETRKSIIKSVIEKAERLTHKSGYAAACSDIAKSRAAHASEMKNIQDFEKASIEHDDPTMIRAAHASEAKAWEVRKQIRGYMIFAKDGSDVVDFSWLDEKYPIQIANNHNATLQPHDCDPRIYSRCPACQTDCLHVIDKHLICTWHKCPNPTLIDNLPNMTNQQQSDDTKRLDWLDSAIRNGQSTDIKWPDGNKPIREAIDSAMSQTKEKE